MRFLPLIFLLFFGHAFDLNAQVDSVYMGRPADTSGAARKKIRNNDWMKKFTWGGNFQAWIGNPTFVFLSPTLGYTPHKNVNLGLGVIYNYTQMRSTYGNYSQSIFGGHSYARYIFADSYFVQLQYDKLRQPDLFASDPRARRWVNYFLGGIGLRQPIGEHVAFITSLMYNFIADPLSIYPSRVILQFGIVGSF